MENIIHCQLGHSARSLNADLFRDILLDNCICNNCEFHIENAFFFFQCPKNVKERKIFIKSIKYIKFGRPKTYNS